MKTKRRIRLVTEDRQRNGGPPTKEEYGQEECLLGFWILHVLLVLGMLSAGSAAAATHYVWQGSPSPAPPYTNWASAAHVIQDAVDAADPGALVLVTNGVYATGGRALSEWTTTNRVAVDKPLILSSVNGPSETIIQGRKVPGRGNDRGAIRCVYLADGACLSGFTLTNGATMAEIFSPDRGNPERVSGGGVFCESLAAVVTNCVLVGNLAYQSGGGSYSGTLNNCRLTANSLGSTYFFDQRIGGGAFGGTLNNCCLTANFAPTEGGGAHSCTLNNCTLTGNSAHFAGGGAADSEINNCILYFNEAAAGANCWGGTANYSCATPLPPGIGNISMDPLLASSSHLSADSPCIGRGNVAYATGTDIDGEPWAEPPSMGCDEPVPDATAGPLVVGIESVYSTVGVGFQVRLTALIEGQTDSSVWDFGDETLATNRAYATHVWDSPGSYEVVLRASNQTYPDGISATVTVQVAASPVHFVDAASGNPIPPYTSWETAATTIQDAVDAATVPGAMVLVTNGVYATGGRAVYMTTNRVAVDKPLNVLSVNGPEFTLIRGYQVPATRNGDGAVRCVYLADDATLSGFTLTNGATLSTGGDLVRDESGGGVWCESSRALVSDCVLAGNSASGFGGGASRGTLSNCTLPGNLAERGGGAFEATLNHCALTGNAAAGSGGGVYLCSVDICRLTNNQAGYGGGAEQSAGKNSTLAGNRADYSGGGASFCTLDNCVVYFNEAPENANYRYSSLNYSCTTPLPTNGVGNIDSNPLFVDANQWSNLRLQATSPCINAGDNDRVTDSTDLDGNARVVGGTVDMGAYEFQSPQSLISYAWLQQYGLPTDGSADSLDADFDGLNAWQEWKAWTVPTNSFSVLRLFPPQPIPTGMAISWQSEPGQHYVLERAADVSGPFSVLRSEIVGQAGTTSITDTNIAGESSFIYRVSVP